MQYFLIKSWIHPREGPDKAIVALQLQADDWKKNKDGGT
jgi:hypothetical protein